MHANTPGTFYHLLANTLVVSIANSFVWFALTFWIFLQTKSVLVTSIIAGVFAVSNMICAFFFGVIVDRNKKLSVIRYSTIVSLVFYTIGTILFLSYPLEVFTDPSSIMLWVLIIVLMIGSVTGNLRMIALSTLVNIFFPQSKDKANGMIGTVNGVGFALTSVFSGLVIGFLSMSVALFITLGATVIALVHLSFLSVDEPNIVRSEDAPKTMGIKETFAIVSGINGLFGLIFFTTFNNFLGGVFMALMDAYGLSLVSVQAWGIILAAVSVGFIGGGIYISQKGLGPKPLRTLLRVNVVMWIVTILFVIQPWVALLVGGMLVWMLLTPFIEATEHTIIQSVVPFERQGRVIGFAQSIESAAMPITAFLIGPIAQFVFIPFMTTGKGVELMGGWFGIGIGRGIALVFILAGVIGLIVTLLAFRSRSYKLLSSRYSWESAT